MSCPWQKIRTLLWLTVMFMLFGVDWAIPVRAAAPLASSVVVQSAPQQLAMDEPTAASAVASVGPQLPLQRYPAIAYNSKKNEYLVVWWNNTIHGRIFRGNGPNEVIPVSDVIHLSTTQGGEERLAVVYNSLMDEYFVLWKDGRNFAVTHWDIYAQRVAANGTLVGENLAIANEIEEQFLPVVAFNSTKNEYLLAWADLRNRATNDYDIYGQIVTGAGQPQGNNFVIAANQRWQAYPAIAYNSDAQEYLVVWQEDERQGVPDDILGQRLLSTGQPAGGPIIISNAANRQRSPAVIYDAAKKQYLVVWYDYRQDPAPDPPIDPDVYGQLLSGNGTLLGEPFPILAGLGAQFWPVVAHNGADRYLVAWFDNYAGNPDIRARFLNESGTPLGEAFRAHEPSGAAQEWPAVAYGARDQEYWIIWHDQRADFQNWQFYVSRWSTNFTKLGKDFPLPPGRGQTLLKGNASISLTGPITTTINGKVTYTYNAAVKPITATYPLRFDWAVAGQPDVTRVRSSTDDSFSFTASTNTPPAVIVTATDVEGNSVRSTPYNPDEPNNPCSQATPIQASVTYTSYLPTADDVDYYKITVDQPYANLLVTLHEPVDYELELLDDCPENGGIIHNIGIPTPILGVDRLFFNVNINTGDYYLRVRSKTGNQSVQPYTLRAEINPTDPAAVQTLFLVNTPALQVTYGFTRTGRLLDKLQTLAGHALVQGLTIQVDQDAAVAKADAQWRTELTNTDRANDLAAAIKAYVAGLLETFPKVKQGGYLVIVGDDRIVPFRRIPIQPSNPSADPFWVSEQVYAEKVLHADPRSTVGAALYAGQTLSDDYYADFTPTAAPGDEILLPDLAIGRLVETPEEMTTVIDAFLQTDGQVKLDRGVVVGYDFVLDAAVEQCQKLRAVGLSMDCDLVKNNWSAQDFKDRVLKAPLELASNNGHTAHFQYRAPDGSGVSPRDILEAADLRNDLFYTIGCQAGLVVPPGETEELDFAQAFARKGATYIANTGWGYGMVDALGLSERVSTLFTAALVAQESGVGHALRQAKANYFLTESRFDHYDEKVLSELTLYGLPMLRFTTTAAVNAAAPVYSAQQHPLPLAAQTDPATARITFTPTTFAKISLAQGDYYTGTGYLLANPLEPLQPGLWARLENSQGPARGVLLVGGVFTQEVGFNPVIGIADDLNQLHSSATITEPEFTTAGFYPPRLLTLNQVSGGGERREVLVLALGQFDSATATERLWKKITVDVFYSNDSDHTPPQIGPISISRTDQGQFAVVLPVNDGQGAGLHRVLATYATRPDANNIGTSETIELTLRTTDGLWSGVIPLQDPNDWLLIQAVDKAGNVTAADWLNRVYLPVIQR